MLYLKPGHILASGFDVKCIRKCTKQDKHHSATENFYYICFENYVVKFTTVKEMEVYVGADFNSFKGKCI